MKKVSNKYVNFGIAFALLGILVFSLIMSPLEGFKEAADTEETDTTDTDTKTEKKSTTKTAATKTAATKTGTLLPADNIKELQKMLKEFSDISSSKEAFSDINEPLTILQHLGHLSEKEEEQSKLV